MKPISTCAKPKIDWLCNIAAAGEAPDRSSSVRLHPSKHMAHNSCQFHSCFFDCPLHMPTKRMYHSLWSLSALTAFSKLVFKVQKCCDSIRLILSWSYMCLCFVLEQNKKGLAGYPACFFVKFPIHQMSVAETLCEETEVEQQIDHTMGWNHKYSK